MFRSTFLLPLPHPTFVLISFICVTLFVPPIWWCLRSTFTRCHSFVMGRPHSCCAHTWCDPRFDGVRQHSTCWWFPLCCCCDLPDCCSLRCTVITVLSDDPPPPVLSTFPIVDLRYTRYSSVPLTDIVTWPPRTYRLPRYVTLHTNPLRVTLRCCGVVILIRWCSIPRSVPVHDYSLLFQWPLVFDVTLTPRWLLVKVTANSMVMTLLLIVDTYSIHLMICWYSMLFDVDKGLRCCNCDDDWLTIPVTPFIPRRHYYCDGSYIDVWRGKQPHIPPTGDDDCWLVTRGGRLTTVCCCSCWWLITVGDSKYCCCCPHCDR